MTLDKDELLLADEIESKMQVIKEMKILNSDPHHKPVYSNETMRKAEIDFQAYQTALEVDPFDYGL